MSKKKKSHRPAPSPQVTNPRETKNPAPASSAGAMQRSDAGMKRADDEPNAKTTLDQRRAKFALERVRLVNDRYPGVPQGGGAGGNRETAREYRAYVRGLPAVIISNGLGQAIAMELAQSQRKQGGEAHGLLLDHVTAWLVSEEGWGSSSPYLRSAKSDAQGRYRTAALIGAIIEKSEADMARAQIEVMAFMKWLKIFAVALIESSGASGKTEEAGDMESAS